MAFCPRGAYPLVVWRNWHEVNHRKLCVPLRRYVQVWTSSTGVSAHLQLSMAIIRDAKSVALPLGIRTTDFAGISKREIFS